MKINDCVYSDVCCAFDTEKCTQVCTRYLEMKGLLIKSGIPENKWKPKSLTPDDVDFDAFCKLADIKDGIKQFVSDGKNLYIHSKTTGNGKTSWSIKIMLKYFDLIWAGNGFKCRGIFVHTPTLLAKLKDFDNKSPEIEKLKNNLPYVDLVIWDDIASTNLSNYDLGQLTTLIDQRILCEKSNIFTGNFGFEGMNKYLGPRLASRIWNTSEKIELFGGDKR